MQLIDHVSITVRQLAQVQDFYEAIMQVLGACVAYRDADAIGFGERNSAQDASHSYLSIFESSAAQADPRRHYCLRAASREAVRAFHAAALANGGQCAGAPGFRHYHPEYFAAFVLDPEGNKIEAVFHHAVSNS